ncbi:3-hydroxybutyryl-CoA dehydrogenase [Rhodococcus wratislaviensis]|nr:3-hydroxybutyryl-CoA dehydrogenase [Rhodococcus wratislaviensis]
MGQAPHVAIVGAGRMGQGIALAFIHGGLSVALIDMKEREPDDERLYSERVRLELDRELCAKIDLGWITAEQARESADRVHIFGREDGLQALSDADVVFEAVPEVMTAKAAALSLISDVARHDIPVASTTSSFLVTELAKLIDGPQRFLNAHWLNPADLMPLVEISRSEQTDGAVIDDVVGLLERIGKVPVVCSASAGYIVPRIQALAMNEAARMVEEGVASAEDVDKAVRVGFGLRFAVLGLVEFIDWGGGDILYYASRYLADMLGDRFEAPEVIAANMASNRNGLRDGQGFYTYDPDTVGDYKSLRMREFSRLLDEVGLSPEYGAALAPVPEKTRHG